jgi:hypothetical protein
MNPGNLSRVGVDLGEKDNEVHYNISSGAGTPIPNPSQISISRNSLSIFQLIFQIEE